MPRELVATAPAERRTNCSTLTASLVTAAFPDAGWTFEDYRPAEGELMPDARTPDSGEATLRTPEPRAAAPVDRRDVPARLDAVERRLQRLDDKLDEVTSLLVGELAEDRARKERQAEARQKCLERFLDRALKLAEKVATPRLIGFVAACITIVILAGVAGTVTGSYGGLVIGVGGATPPPAEASQPGLPAPAP